ncbi:MAG TPA: hypothetical protein VK726_03265 [Acetobacteraceae bacterium]|jgi:hypothetical protein|nr:hypothetical protein [Acetobacteraceae bacterium]
MTKTVCAIALGAAAAVTSVLPAIADAFTINSTSVPNNVAVTINSAAPAPVVNENDLAGAISANVTDTTSSMTVWCADIKDRLRTPGGSTLTTLSAEIGQTNYTPLDATKVNQVNALHRAVTAGLVSATTPPHRRHCRRRSGRSSINQATAPTTSPQATSSFDPTPATIFPA